MTHVDLRLPRQVLEEAVRAAQARKHHHIRKAVSARGSGSQRAHQVRVDRLDVFTGRARAALGWRP